MADRRKLLNPMFERTEVRDDELGALWRGEAWD
jgi:hypothetical protein